MSQLFPGLAQARQQLVAADSVVTDDWTTFFAKPELPTSAYQCPECLSDRWVTVEDEEAICKRCATSLGYSVTASAEYRWFGAEDRSPDPTRVGNPMNPLLPESSLGTRIIARPGEHRAMRKIRQYHLWNVMPYRERTLWNVFEGLQVRAANAGISSAIVEETKQLYAHVSPLCICRGPQKDALMAACLFESLKRHDTPRRPAEIADIFKIDMKLITRGVKQFAGLLDEHLHAVARAATVVAEPKGALDEEEQAQAEPTLAPAPTPVIPTPLQTPSTSFRHYLEPAILRLLVPRALTGILQEHAEGLGDMLDELGVCPETTPPSLAACAIALACQKVGTPKVNADIAAACGISVATLQKCLKRIEPWKPVIFKGHAAP